MVWHGGCDGQLIRAGERRHLRLKHTGDDRYGPHADCRRHRLVAQAAQRKGFEPPLSGHPHERSAQTDDARPRGGEEPPRIEVQRRQRVLRKGPEETRQLTLHTSCSTAIGALHAPRIRLRPPTRPDVGLDHHSASALRDAYTVGEFPRAEPAVRILVIEDEKKVARALREGLEAEHYEVHTAADGEEGFSLASRDSFDLVLLDLMLPRRDGIEVLTALRKRRVPTPVFILTAKDAVEDRVLGLDRGADDYLVKPFTFPELLARIRALLRRGTDPVLKLQHEALHVDLAKRKVARGEQSVELTGKEFEVLEC